MQIRTWLDNLVEATAKTGDHKFRIILKAGNELDIEWDEEVDCWGSDDELTNGNYMIDTRSIAAIQYLD